MKALTLWQPYAQAIVAGLKKYETRSWNTKHRGRLAIHASLKHLSKENRKLAEKYNLNIIDFGKILVICDLEDCILIDEKLMKLQKKTELDFGDWRIGRYAWKLKIVEILSEPKIEKGHQGLWNLK